MLNTHRRRLLKCFVWGGAIAFDPAAAWLLDNSRLVTGPLYGCMTFPIHVGVPATDRQRPGKHNSAPLQRPCKGAFFVPE